MIRIVVQTQDFGAAAHCDGAKAVVSYDTFDIEAPELEAFLRQRREYGSAQIIGAELQKEKD